MPQNSPTNSLPKAILWMATASFSFAGMTALVRLISERISVLENSTFRGLFSSVILLCLMPMLGISVIGTHRRALLYRGLIGAISMLTYFYAVSGGNLAESVTLIRTTGLMIPFVALWTLGERIKRRHYFCAIAGFIGTVLIIKPGIDKVSVHAVAALIAAVVQAVAWTSVRALAGKEHPATVTFYFCFFSTISGSLGMFVMNEPIVVPVGIDWLWMVLLSIFGLIGQFALVYAYKYAPAGVISPVGYSEVVFSAFLGWLMFNQTIGLVSCLGVIIIFLSATLIQSPIKTFREWKADNAARERDSLLQQSSI